MIFNKTLLTIGLCSLALSATVQAEPDPWGAVAESSETSSWGASAAASADSAPVPVSTPQAAPGKLACGTDDPRYASLVPILRELQAGQSIEPMQTSFSTFVTLNTNVRQTLGDNIYISSPDCSDQYLFEGALTGKVNIPFTELWQLIYDSLRTDDPELMNFAAKNVRVLPESALSVISMAQFVPLDEGQIRKLYAIISPGKANATDAQTPLMLEVFLAFGGLVQETDRGKTAFIDERLSSRIEGIYLERKEGNVQLSNVKGKNIGANVASLLQTAGLRAQVVPGDRARQAAEK